jgi:hypothetical protein
MYIQYICNFKDGVSGLWNRDMSACCKKIIFNDVPLPDLRPSRPSPAAKCRQKDSACPLSEWTLEELRSTGVPSGS